MKDICVVRLVWAALGIEYFRRFIESYNKHRAGAEHDLLIMFKGFDKNKPPQDYRALMNETVHCQFISDDGQDITAYYKAFHEVEKNYLFCCFLNDYSEILADDWLKKLYTHVSKPGVGLAGATGSWEAAPGYPPFPNFHIRTNTFIVDAEIMKAAEVPVVLKSDANNFEAGQKSLTRTALALGRNPLIVGKDNMGYKKECWNQSYTFRKGDQSNLLVADNRTEHYQHATYGMRRYLALLAWGA